MDVDQKDSLGSVSDNTLQQETCSNPCSNRPIPKGRDGLNLGATGNTDKGEHTDKLAALKKILERDLKAADIKWSIFVCSAQSYRFDSCLKPFPPLYMDGLERDIDRLVRMNGTIIY